MFKYFVSILLLTQVSFSDIITLVADEWCPYNCTAGSKNPGYMIEVAQLIFHKAGHKVIYTTSSSWEAAIKKSRNNKYNAIVGAAKSDAPDFIYPENEIGVSQMAFIIHSSSSWQYTGLDSLSQVTLGAITNYSYNEEIDTYIQQHKDNPKKVQLVSGDLALYYNMQKLTRGIISTLIDDRAVIKYYFKSKKLTNPFMFVNVDAESKSYIAFSPSHSKSKEYATILSNGIDQLRESGELNAIMQKYGLSDWKEE